MSHTRFRTRDANRWGKKYSLVRVRKVPVLVIDRETWIEGAEIKFNGVDVMTYHFKQDFPDTPIVTATAVDTNDLDVSNVNIFISSVDKFTVTVGSSNVFTGTVMLHAIHIAESDD
jgi:hypothetical protein